MHMEARPCLKKSPHSNPANSRFISQDTYGGELNDVDQWHLYAHCANNPINYVDPAGHWRTISRDWAAFILDVGISVFAPGAWGAYDIVGECIELYLKKKNIRKISSKLIYVVVPKVEHVYGKYYTKIRKAIYRATGYTIKYGAPWVVSQQLTNTAKWLAGKKYKQAVDIAMCLTSLGGAVALFLDRFSDGKLNSRIKVY